MCAEPSQHACSFVRRQVKGNLDTCLGSSGVTLKERVLIGHCHLGMENVKSFHINDSLTELGSHKDRHANLGEGKIGEGAFKILFKQLPSMPFMLETPALKKPDTMAKEILKMKELAKI